MQESAPVSLERINEMTAGDPEFLREIVAMYVEDATSLVTELEGYIGRADAPGLKVVAHKLKGSSLNMGVPRVAALAKDLEDMGKAGQCGRAAHDVLQSLRIQLDVAKQAFEDLVRNAA